MSQKEDFLQSLKQIDFQKNPVFPVINTYCDFTSPFNIEYLKHIVAATYLDYKKLYPDFDIFILWRVKTNPSFQKNISKTAVKNIYNRDTPSVEYFQRSLIKDILGMKIVINNLPNTLNFDRSDPKNTGVFELYKQKLRNLNFIEQVDDWLHGDTDEFQSEETFYKYYIELLDRLDKAKYSQCYDEEEVPYAERRDNAIAKMQQLKQKNNFSLEISDEQIRLLEELIRSLERRLDDKLENEILNVTLDRVLNEGPLLKKLHVHSSREESASKENGWMYTSDGYVALYEHITTDSGLQIECQAQSRKGYRDDKGGVSFHNGMPGKKINIDLFFELVDSNDKNPLSYYLRVLKNIPFSALENVSPILSNKSKKRALEAMKHIKIKDEIIFQNGNSNPHAIPLKQYLKDFTDYYAPILGTTNAGHNSIRPTVNIVQKSDAQELEDVIRDKDGLSVLAKLLIDKYEELYPSHNFLISFDEAKITEFAKNLDRQKTNDADCRED